MQDGKYTVKESLGIGGFGITYQAEDNRNHLVIIKTLKDSFQNHSLLPIHISKHLNSDRNSIFEWEISFWLMV